MSRFWSDSKRAGLCVRFCHIQIMFVIARVCVCVCEVMPNSASGVIERQHLLWKIVENLLSYLVEAWAR